MASITLAQAALLSNDELVKGVAESIITIDRFFERVPFRLINNRTLRYNREASFGTAGTFNVGDSLAAVKDAATTTEHNADLKKFLSDVEIDDFVQSTYSDTNDQLGYQLSSKAKAVGYEYYDDLINADSVADTTKFDGLLNLSTQNITETNAVGDVLTFEILDELLDQVVDKNGAVDFMIMNRRDLRAYKSAIRALGGASSEMVNMPDGTQILGYNGTPIYVNDRMAINQTSAGGGTYTDGSSIIAGNFDDGSNLVGISGLTSQENAGMHVKYIGPSETKDEEIWRVKWYAGLALWNSRGLAVRSGITPNGA